MTLHVETAGVFPSKVTTVLLHGFLGSARNLRTLAHRWAEQSPGRGFIVPDLPGHGSSPPVPRGAGLRTLAERVLETVQSLGASGPLTFAGHSFGGRVALAMADLYPQVQEVILLDIAPGPLPKTLETYRVLEVLLRAPPSAPTRKAMREALVQGGLSSGLAEWLVLNLEETADGVAWRIDREALAQLHVRTNAEDLWPIVERLGAQARCIRGERSAYVAESDLDRMRRAGCRVDTVAGAGHYVHVEALEALLALLAK